MCTICAANCRFSPVGSRAPQAGGAGHAARRHAARRVAPARGRPPRNSCNPFSTDRPARMHAAQEHAPGGREAAPLSRDADERDGRPEHERTPPRRRRSGRRPPRPGTLGVEDRDDVVAAVAEDAVHRLAVVRVGRVPLGEDQQPSADTEPRPLPRGCTPSTNATPGTGIVGEQEVPVEVDVITERGHQAAGGDPEPRLDHAAEHHAEPERARGVGDANRLPDRHPTSRA